MFCFLFEGLKISTIISLRFLLIYIKTQFFKSIFQSFRLSNIVTLTVALISLCVVAREKSVKQTFLKLNFISKNSKYWDKTLQ
jgi:hypothetical protein